MHGKEVLARGALAVGIGAGLGLGARAGMELLEMSADYQAQNQQAQECAGRLGHVIAKVNVLPNACASYEGGFKERKTTIYDPETGREHVVERIFTLPTKQAFLKEELWTDEKIKNDQSHYNNVANGFSILAGALGIYVTAVYMPGKRSTPKKEVQLPSHRTTMINQL